MADNNDYPGTLEINPDYKPNILSHFDSFEGYLISIGGLVDKEGKVKLGEVSLYPVFDPEGKEFLLNNTQVVALSLGEHLMGFSHYKKVENFLLIEDIYLVPEFDNPDNVWRSVIHTIFDCLETRVMNDCEVNGLAIRIPNYNRLLSNMLLKGYGFKLVDRGFEDSVYFKKVEG
ncbi:MAG: hypothetical protein Q8Q35_01855 [Nanoarchaeota archaeon]|nr:hypothetical protein [Nanoarchaeota archaeon]